MGFSAEGFFQGTAQALPHAVEMYDRISMMPTKRAMAEQQIAVSQQQMQMHEQQMTMNQLKMKVAQQEYEESQKGYSVDTIMAMKGVDKETNEGRAVHKWLSQNADEGGIIRQSQFAHMEQIAKTTGVSDSIMKAKVKDSELKLVDMRSKLLTKHEKLKENPGDVKLKAEIEDLARQVQDYDKMHQGLVYKAAGLEKEYLEDRKTEREMEKQFWTGYRASELEKERQKNRKELKETPPGKAPATPKEFTPEQIWYYNRYLRMFDIRANDPHGMKLCEEAALAKNAKESEEALAALRKYQRNIKSGRTPLSPVEGVPTQPNTSGVAYNPVQSIVNPSAKK